MEEVHIMNDYISDVYEGVLLGKINYTELSKVDYTKLLERFYEPRYRYFKKIYTENKKNSLNNKMLTDVFCDFDNIDEKIILITVDKLIYVKNEKIKAIELKSIDCEIMGRAVMVKNNIDKEELLYLEKRSCYQNGWITTPEYPLYLLYEREVLNIMFQLEDMQELLCNHRIVWLLKEFTFEKYFENIQTMLPSLVMDLSEDEFKLLDSYNAKRLKQKDQAIEDYTKYYYDNSEKIIDNIKQGTPTVMLISDFFEFEVNVPYASRKKELDLANIDSLYSSHGINCLKAFRDMGSQVIVVADESKIKRKELDIYLKINEFKPDIIISGCLRHFRFQVEKIPNEVIFVTWIQDPVPAVMDKTTPSRLGERDFVLNHFISWKEILDVGYDLHTLIEAPIPANDKLYKPYQLTEEENNLYRCDICIFGSIDEVSEEEFIETIFTWFKNESIGNILLEIWKNYQEDTYNGIVNCDNKEIRDYFKKVLCEKTNGINFDNVLDSIADAFTTRAQTLYRIFLVDWFIDAGYTKIKVWGRGWDEFKTNPRYSKYIMGIAEGGEKLSKILQSSKIVIGNNIYTSAAARVWETMLSKGFYISNYINPEQDWVDLRLILKENEEFDMFHNKKELLEKIEFYLTNEEERQKMIEIGYKKAKERMTFESVMKRLLKNISERL